MLEIFILSGLIAWSDKILNWASWKLLDAKYRKQGQKLAIRRMGN